MSDLAGADLTRAIVRPGIDEDQATKLHAQLAKTIDGTKRQLARAEKDKAVEDEARAVQEENEKLGLQAEAREQERQQYWNHWSTALRQQLDLGPETAKIEKPKADLALTLTKGKTKTDVHLVCCEPGDDDGVQAVVRFILRHELYSAVEVQKLCKSIRKSLKLPKPKSNPWTLCADEGSACKCSGTVLYGSSEHESGEDLSEEENRRKQVSGSVMCDNGGMLGDPAEGEKKRCWCRAAGPGVFLSPSAVH